MGLTRIRAEQISDIDYKQAVRVISTTNVNLSGGAPSVVDNVNLTINDRILVNGQTLGAQNGLYVVQTVGTGNNGTWVRSSDANATGEIEAGMIVMVTEGQNYADSQWKLTTNDPIVVGTTPLSFSINILTAVGGSNTQVQYNNAGVMAGSANFTFDGANVVVAGNITAANVTAGNINSVNADLAEIYVSDSNYQPGTVVVFGGIYEITITDTYADSRVAGVISTAPAYTMNVQTAGLPVALQGRVPCMVVGNVAKGDLITTSNIPGVGTVLQSKDWQPGCVIGKSLETSTGQHPRLVEVVVGRL